MKREAPILHPIVTAGWRKWSTKAKSDLFSAVMAWSEGEEYPITDKGILNYIWPAMKAKLEENRSAYQHKCKVTSEAGKKSAEKRWGYQREEAPKVTGVTGEVTDVSNIKKSNVKNYKIMKCKNRTTGVEQSSPFVVQSTPPAASSLSFNGNEITGWGPEDVARWSKAFPLVDVLAEIAKMGAWLYANPTKRKINYEPFIVRWLGKEQHYIELQNNVIGTVGEVTRAGYYQRRPRRDEKVVVDLEIH